MAKISKSDVDIYHRVLLTGLSGSGKSTLAAQLATQFKIIWIDLENAKDVLTKLPEEAIANIEYIRIPDSASYPIAAQTLMHLFKNNKANICDEHGKHDCALCKKDNKPFTVVDFNSYDENTIVVVDSVTQLSASILAYATKDKPVDYKPDRDDWGALRKYSEFFASQFQAFPWNLVCTAQAVEAELEDGRVKLVPSFGSKDMSSKIAKAFSDVIYTDVKNKKHIAFGSSVAANNVLTKSRSDFLIELMDTPSLIPLFKNEINKVTVQPTVGTPAQQAVKNLSSFLGAKK